MHAKTCSMKCFKTGKILTIHAILILCSNEIWGTLAKTKHDIIRD